MLQFQDLWIGLPVFVAVALGCIAIWVVLSELLERRRIGERLNRVASPTGQKTAQSPVNLLREELTDRLASINWASWLAAPARLADRLIEQAGINVKPITVVAMSGALGLVGLSVFLLLPLTVVLRPLGIVLALLPWLWIYLCRRRRIRRFEAQLPDALGMLARAMRAGHSLPTALHMVGEEMPPPVGEEFLRVYEAQNLGRPIEEALEELAERVPLVDVRFLVTAISIQRQTGGDLCEVLDKLAYVIRERFKLYGQVRALTAEGRLSGWVLNALPVIVFIALLSLNPDYVLLLFRDPLGKKMVAIAGVMQIVGALAIRKIVNIKV